MRDYRAYRTGEEGAISQTFRIIFSTSDFLLLCYKNLVGQFNKLVQKGKVDEYIYQFDVLRNYVMAEEGFHRESYYVDNFISGLKEEIAQHLYNHKPQSLQQARELARGQEHYLNMLDKRYKSATNTMKTHPYSTVNYKIVSSYPKPTTEASKPQPAPTTSNDGYKKLTLAELTERKQQGLCFYCDQNFEPGHNCRKKKLFIIMNEGTHGTSNLDEEGIAISWEEPALNSETTTEAQMSLHALTGLGGDGTLKMSLISPITFDYGSDSISFKWHDKMVTLPQASPTAKVQVQLNGSSIKASQEEAYFLIQIASIDDSPNPASKDKLSANFISLLNDYRDVFAEPTQLPPPRSQDRYIPLKPNSTPVNAHPYRCPIAHREEIEKITKEILRAGVIRASTSPFASPVLLVRKKDNSWRLVVDYRALNDITVKNKYPIPVIEELLADIKGSNIYSKLDLRSGYHQIRVHNEDIFKLFFVLTKDCLSS
ncbi:hypothetical protein AgCh_024096 [Apium graveolens]